jgi:hypothetical protein
MVASSSLTMEYFNNMALLNYQERYDNLDNKQKKNLIAEIRFVIQCIKMDTTT